MNTDATITDLAILHFPDCEAITFLSNNLIVELPALDKTAHLERLSSLPQTVRDCFVPLRYHNGPLPNTPTPPRHGASQTDDITRATASHEGIIFEHNSSHVALRTAATVKAFVLGQGPNLHHEFCIDSPATGKQMLESLGRRWVLGRTGSHPQAVGPPGGAALNKREIENGVSPSASWHTDYRDTAYIYFGGLPYDLTEGDVITIFSQFGEPVFLKLARDKETGKSKGFGWLKYEDQRSTDLAVDNLGGAEIAGRLVSVDHARYKMRDDEDPEEGKVGWEDMLRRERAEKGLRSEDESEEEDEEEEEEEEGKAKSRPMLKEEEELQKLIRDHDDDDPMKQFLIDEKKKEVEEALRKEKKRSERHSRSHRDKDRDSSHRHHHHHHHHHRSHRSRRDDDGDKDRRTTRDRDSREPERKRISSRRDESPPVATEKGSRADRDRDEDADRRERHRRDSRDRGSRRDKDRETTEHRRPRDEDDRKDRERRYRHDSEDAGVHPTRRSHVPEDRVRSDRRGSRSRSPRPRRD
ncbi:hypothetical protein B0T17DRAFT_658070 [Bombardia bombarda]|uniref:RRM domain-containing protein n=1 Tax=Bombardia bombarda TaxID=252184 RepID=A0AA39U626_9PEZI|nr:hypothetical protein B0T17DRAFT_658070 [Bombardia bombarda]